MGRGRNRVRSAISVLCAVAGITAFGIRAHAANLDKPNVTIAVGGVIGQLDKLPYAIALDKGYFKDEGLNINSIDFGSGAKGLQAMVGGAADLTQGAYEHVIQMQPKKINLVCFTPFARYPGNVLAIVKSEADKIKTVADLKGKKIGVSSIGSATYNFVVGLLAKHHIRPDEVSFINTGNGASAVAAVRAGHQVDAIVSLDPAISELESTGDIKILADSRTKEGTEEAYGGAYMAGCLYGHDDFIEKYPKTAQALANAMERSMQWLSKASIDQIVASVPKAYYKNNEKVYRAALKADLPSFTWNGIMTPAMAKNVYNSLVVSDPKLPSEHIDLSKTYTNKFMEEAVKKYH